MGSLLPQAALVEHENAVGPLDGREPMGDDDGGPAFEQHLECLLDEALCLGVDARGGLVEHENGAVEGQGPGEGDELALARREVAAPLGNGHPQPGGVGVDEAARPGGLHGAGDRLGSNAIAEPDIFLYRPGEEEDVLEDQGDAAAQLLDLKGADVHPVEEDAAPPDLVEALQQLDDRGLARPRGSDDCDRLSRLGPEG